MTFVPSWFKPNLTDTTHHNATTTLLSEWIEILRAAPETVHQKETCISWVSLDEGDNHPASFLSYLLMALRENAAISTIGQGALRALQSPQPAPSEAILSALINELAGIAAEVILVLDDFHAIESRSIHDALTFLLDRQPPQLHLVIATREDLNLPLANFRAKDQMVEIRAAELRFSIQFHRCHSCRTDLVRHLPDPPSKGREPCELTGGVRTPLCS